MDAQARHASVGINPESQVRDAIWIGNREAILRVAGKRRFWQQRIPYSDRVLELLGLRISIHRAVFQFAVVREIAFEMRGVDDNSANDSGQAQLHDAPVVAGSAPPPRLPAVHPFAEIGKLVGDPNRRGGFQQIFFRREKFVIGRKDAPAQPFRGEIDVFSKIHQCLPRRSNAPRGLPKKCPRS